MTFFRIYEDGKPVATPNHFKWSPAGSKEGELTLVTGHPGTTQRLKTIAELKMLRDYTFPRSLEMMSEYRGFLTQFQERGAEQRRIASDTLFGYENAIKAVRGEHQALLDSRFFASKEKEETAFRAKVQANPKWRKEYGQLWAEQVALLEKQRDFDSEVVPLNRLMQFSALFRQGVRLVRMGMELPKPDADRLMGYHDSQLPVLRQQVLSKAPLYKEFEIENLTFALTKMRESLGPDHPAVKAMLGKLSPREVAKAAVNGSGLDNPEVRKALMEGGAKSVDASGDPMIVLARTFEPLQRALITKQEKDLQPETTRISEALAKARFDAFGTSIYPDATFSLRLSYGKVRGWRERGQEVRPYTILGGAYERATGAEPFALPSSWIDNKSKLDLTVPFNLATTNDIIGGNSGSPLINKNAEVIGLIFDGNIHSLGGAFGFDESLNRAVAVDSRAITETLNKIYDAGELLKELGVSR
jgi:hypothetical protein